MSRRPVWENMKVWIGATWCMAARRADSSEATCSTWFSWHVSTSPGEVSTFRTCNQIQSSAWTQSRYADKVKVSRLSEVAKSSQICTPSQVSEPVKCQSQSSFWSHSGVRASQMSEPVKMCRHSQMYACMQVVRLDSSSSCSYL